MADPVMSDLPLRKVLECVMRDYQTREEMLKLYFQKYPLEGWIHFSDAIRKKVFKEEKESDFDEKLFRLVLEGYVEKHETKQHPRYAHLKLRRVTPFYRLTEKARAARASLKR